MAELQGNSGLAGGTGAVIGESAAWFISEKLYGKKVEELTESEKENLLLNWPFFLSIPVGIAFWIGECRRLGIKIFGK